MDQSTNLNTQLNQPPVPTPKKGLPTMTPFLFTGFLILLSGIIGFYLGAGQSKSLIKSPPVIPTKQPTIVPSKLQGTACTMETKICPDGSTVGRVGSNCEFSPCPEILNKIVEIKGLGMLPTYQNNQYVTVARSPYINNRPQRGDIIIFKSLTNPDVEYIKRIIGLPGETVTIKNNVTLINSTVLDEPYLYEKNSTQTFPGGYMVEGIGKLVPEEQYFVMGDNRKHSSDSREFGLIPFSHIIGEITDKNQSNYICPKSGWVNCMPILTEEAKKACSQDTMSWYKKNCPNFQGAAL